MTKNTNDAIQGTLGKYYARVEYKGTIGLRELASHMHHHNTAFSKGIITGVLGDMVDCIKELALLGYVVKDEALSAPTRSSPPTSPSSSLPWVP